ncbi:hypothetical protein QTP88_029143 [Uroleucon formosanum]
MALDLANANCVDNNEKIADYLNNNEAGLVRNPNQWIESEIRINRLNPKSRINGLNPKSGSTD